MMQTIFVAYLCLSHKLQTSYYDKEYFCVKRNRIQFVKATHDSLAHNTKFYRALCYLDGPHNYPMMDEGLYDEYGEYAWKQLAIKHNLVGVGYSNEFDSFIKEYKSCDRIIDRMQLILQFQELAMMSLEKVNALLKSKNCKSNFN